MAENQEDNRKVGFVVKTIDRDSGNLGLILSLAWLRTRQVFSLGLGFPSVNMGQRSFLWLSCCCTA